MNNNERLIDAALDMMRDRENYRVDARLGAAVNNTVVGFLLALTYKAPRWAAESAVRAALDRLEE